GTNPSTIRFANAKNRLYVLEGQTGQALIQSIAQGIKTKSSLWRQLPNLPENPNNVESDIISATQDNGDTADSIRTLTALTMRRASFSLKLRDFEAYELDLEPASWEEHRHAFLNAFVRHVLVPQNYFDLAIYLPRVVRLATACLDFAALTKIVYAVDRIAERLLSLEDVRLTAASHGTRLENKDIVQKWISQVHESIEQS